MENQVVGKIIHIDEKGFGFISSHDIKFTRIFFHWTSLKPNTLHFTKLRLGMRVRFEAKEIDGKGIRAIRVEVIEDDNAADTNDNNDRAVNE